MKERLFFYGRRIIFVTLKLIEFWIRDTLPIDALLSCMFCAFVTLPFLAAFTLFSLDKLIAGSVSRLDYMIGETLMPVSASHQQPRWEVRLIDGTHRSVDPGIYATTLRPERQVCISVQSSDGILSSYEMLYVVSMRRCTNDR